MGGVGGEGCRGAGHRSGMRKRFCSADATRITAHMRLPAFCYAALDPYTWPRGPKIVTERPNDVRALIQPGGAPACFRVWHMAHAPAPAVLCFRCRWPGDPGSIDLPPGVTLSRKDAKSRTGGRKLVMLMARPIPRADLKKQESRWACRRSGSSHVSVGLTGPLNPA